MLDHKAITRAKVYTESGPRSIDATIYDLNGNPIHPGRPNPVLRRTASGHLFQPCNEVIKASEMINSGFLASDEAQPIPVKIVAIGQEFRATSARQGQVYSCTWPSSTPLGFTYKQACVARFRDVHDCRGESKGHRCWVAGLCKSTRPGSNTLPMTAKLVNNEKRMFLGTLDTADDVWMQIARELEYHESRSNTTQ
jgi:hypothetical protein